MTFAAPIIWGIAYGFLLSLAPILQPLAVADEHTLPFPMQGDFSQQRTDQEYPPARVDHPHSTKIEHHLYEMGIPQDQDFIGLLPPAIAAAPINPTTTPSGNKISAVVSYNYGVSLYNEGKVLQAGEEWKTAIRLQPTLSEAQYALSLLAQLQGNEVEAIAYARHAQKHKLDWATAAYHMGLLYYQMGSFPQAREQFHNTLLLQPNHPTALNGLGLIKLREGLLPDAIQAFVMALTGDQNLSYIHHNLGLTFLAQQEWAQAREQFKESLRLDPRLDETYHYLGMTYSAMGQWSQAISSWQRAITLAPHHLGIHRLYYRLGTAYWMTGNPIHARQAYQAAISNHPAWPQAYYQLGVIDMALTQWDQASEHFLTASQLAPEWEQPYFNLGLVRYNQGLLEEALEAFQHAVTLQPDSADAQYHLGLTLRIMQRDRQALMAFEQAAGAGHIAGQEMLAGMYANGRGTTRNLVQAMRWWHRASHGDQGDPAARHARTQLSRLRQQYFLHRHNHTYAQELLEGFQAIQSDLWPDHSQVSRDTIDAQQPNSAGITLANAGHLLEAIPLLLSEAYALNTEAQRYLEFLIQEGMLNRTPTQRDKVIQYFTHTAQEGSLDSCQFLTFLKGSSGLENPYLKLALDQPALCR